MYRTDSRKSINAAVQETGVHGSEKHFLAEHTTLMAILKLDRSINNSDARTSVLLLSQERKQGMKMQHMHQAADHPQCCQ
jgi:hypothetical protein